MIDINGITKKYDIEDSQKILYKNFNLSIKKGEIVTLLGPNGCGKSTLLNVISGIDSDFDGEININKNLEISYMFQKDLLIPWKTVSQNIFIGIEIKQKNIIGVDYKISSLLEEFDLKGYENKYPNYLSGGERQKVALIRNIIVDSEILLMDEPFSAIDFNSKMRSYKWLLKYIKSKCVTVLSVTHDIEEAILLSDRVIIMGNNSRGIIKEFNILIDKERMNFDPIRIKESDKFSKYLSDIWKILSRY